MVLNEIITAKVVGPYRGSPTRGTTKTTFFNVTSRQYDQELVECKVERWHKASETLRLVDGLRRDERLILRGHWQDKPEGSRRTGQMPGCRVERHFSDRWFVVSEIWHANSERGRAALEAFASTRQSTEL